VLGMVSVDEAVQLVLDGKMVRGMAVVEALRRLEVQVQVLEAQLEAARARIAVLEQDAAFEVCQVGTARVVAATPVVRFYVAGGEYG